MESRLSHMLDRGSGDGPVLYNVYTLGQVSQLLKPVSEHFSLITTYRQGTFV